MVEFACQKGICGAIFCAEEYTDFVWVRSCISAKALWAYQYIEL
jgi:hypothetical protein